MKFEMTLESVPSAVKSEMRRAADSGASGAWVIENKHEIFLLAAAAASLETDLRIGAAVAIAFARSPMVLANTGYDLQSYTEGKLVLGLGPQIKAHITRRFSMPWDKPVARMRELIGALHAIWDTWEGKGPLNFRGDFYTHTLMTPAFSPMPHAYGRPPVMLGGARPGDHCACRRGRGRARGTPLRDAKVPRRDNPAAAGDRAGAAAVARARRVELVCAPFFVAPHDPALVDDRIADMKREIAFHGSTPAYWPVLEPHGWAKIGHEMHDLSRRGEWDSVANLVTDEMLEEFAVMCAAGELRTELTKRYGDLADTAILSSEIA